MLKRSQQSFWGDFLSTDGHGPNQAKVKVMQQLNVPENKSELQSLPDLVNYLGKFTPCLAILMQPLRNLL